MTQVDRTSVWRVLLCAPIVLLALLPQIASAHVGVLPAAVPASTLQEFTVRVPTERDIPTTSVRIEFPTNLLVARFEPMPGWTRTVDSDRAGRTIAATWSGGTIAADEYQDFVFMARTPREPGVLTFPAYQTYQDGEVVAWNQAPDADYPAATVEIVVAADAPVAPTELHMEATTAEAEVTTAAATRVAETTTVAVAPTIEPELATPTVFVAPATTEPSVLATPPLVAGGASGMDGGSDLPLFLSLGALVLSVIGVALAAIALARRPAAP